MSKVTNTTASTAELLQSFKYFQTLQPRQSILPTTPLPVSYRSPVSHFGRTGRNTHSNPAYGRLLYL